MKAQSRQKPLSPSGARGASQLSIQVGVCTPGLAVSGRPPGLGAQTGPHRILSPAGCVAQAELSLGGPGPPFAEWDTCDMCAVLSQGQAGPPTCKSVSASPAGPPPGATRGAWEVSSGCPVTCLAHRGAHRPGSVPGGHGCGTWPAGTPGSWVGWRRADGWAGSFSQLQGCLCLATNYGSGFGPGPFIWLSSVGPQRVPMGAADGAGVLGWQAVICPGSLFLYSPLVSSSEGGQVGNPRHAQGVLVRSEVCMGCELLAWRHPNAGPGLQGHRHCPQAPSPFSLELLLGAKVCPALPMQGCRAVPEGPPLTALPRTPRAETPGTPRRPDLTPRAWPRVGAGGPGRQPGGSPPCAVAAPAGTCHLSGGLTELFLRAGLLRALGLTRGAPACVFVRRDINQARDLQRRPQAGGLRGRRGATACNLQEERGG